MPVLPPPPVSATDARLDDRADFVRRDVVASALRLFELAERADVAPEDFSNAEAGQFTPATWAWAGALATSETPARAAAMIQDLRICDSGY
jgi:hypothetical protein